MNTDFHIDKSDSGYRVEMYRNGKPYVTFLDGLSKGDAEREAQRLAILWDKLQNQAEVLIIPKPITSEGGSSVTQPTTVGNTVHYTATCHYGSGSDVDCTTSVSWTSSNPTVAGIQ